MSAAELSRETGVWQQNLSRWLSQARTPPLVASDKCTVREWNVEQKAQLLADAALLSGEELVAHLEGEGVWRLALEESGTAPTATTRRIRKPERELALKEKALAEAAALLVLKKQ